MTDQAEAAAREIAIERARDALRKHGIDINLPHEGDLDDLERDHYDGLVEAYYAIAAAIRSAEPQWQPIESAPRDGTPVLLFAPDAIEPKIFIGFWTEFADQTGAVVDQHWTDFGSEQEFDVELTHWMPLPPPPNGEAGK